VHSTVARLVYVSMFDLQHLRLPPAAGWNRTDTGASRDMTTVCSPLEDVHGVTVEIFPCVLRDHVLVDAERGRDEVRLVRVRVRRVAQLSGERLEFLYALKEEAETSAVPHYGLRIAQSAGVLPAVVARAREKAAMLELRTPARSRLAAPPAEPAAAERRERQYLVAQRALVSALAAPDERERGGDAELRNAVARLAAQARAALATQS